MNHSPASFVRSAVLTAAVMASASLASAQTPAATLRLVGLDGMPKVLTLSDLQALPQIEYVDSSAERGSERFRGPALRTLVSLVGAPEGRALRGPSMTLVVLAEAADGYKVVYSLAELDVQFGGRRALLALSQNDQPLPTSDGPLRIVMPGETHHARWTRQVTTLRLVQAGEPAERRPPNELRAP